jgi:parvulin-like peptidyl-prolyl isomerase
MRCFVVACIIVSLPAAAEVLDRIAVAVNNHAIKESEVIREVRLTEFFNGGPLDLSGGAKRKAADRLIDQTFIRAEMAKGAYPPATDAEVNSVIARIKQTQFHGNPDFQKALAKYGISEADLRAQVGWQIQVLRFIDLRFEPGVRMRAAKNTRPEVIGERVNTEFFAWLDQSRTRARIQFHDEVFQ